MPHDRVLVPDLPVHGTSPSLRPYTFAGVVDVLIELLARRGIARLRAIVGFSSGIAAGVIVSLLGRKLDNQLPRPMLAAR